MWFTECLLKSPSGFANGALEVVDAGLGLAQTSPRLRMNLDLGNSDADSSQRFRHHLCLRLDIVGGRLCA